MTEYDPENIFAKIIDGKVPCHKVYESRVSLAFLDAFPMVEGHTLVVPKEKGYTSIIEMPPKQASEFMRDLPKVAKAVKEATGASAINIWQNNGADAGQTVFHPHFHIVPRKEGDGLFTYPPSSKEMLSKDAADPIVAKISAILNPPKPLKKALFKPVNAIEPDSKGLNLKVEVIGEPEEVESRGLKYYEILCGDSTGSVVLSVRAEQKEGLSVGKVCTIRNGAVKMVKGHVRVAVDKWGKIEALDEALGEEVDKTPAKNVSATEYELVSPN